MAMCENCAGSADDLLAVQRIYLVPEPTVVDEVEAWCAACRSQYPHQPLDSREV